MAEINRGLILEENQRKNAKRRHRVTLLLMLILAVGVVLILNQQATSLWMRYVYRPQLAVTLNQQTILQNQKKAAQQTSSHTTGANDGVNEHINLGDVINSKKYYHEVAGNIIGAIYLPTAGEVSLPILNGGIDKNVQKKNMNIGASTPMTGLIIGKSPNFSLGAHNMWTPGVMFTSITNMKTGDEFYLTDTKKVYVYKVYQQLEVTPQQTEIFDKVPGKKIVTLYTCNHDGDKREVVRGQYAYQVAYAKADKSITHKFNFSKQQKVDL